MTVPTPKMSATVDPVLRGSFLNDGTHLGEEVICQKVTLLHKPI